MVHPFFELSRFHAPLRRGISVVLFIGLLAAGLPHVRAVDTSKTTFLDNYYYNSLISDANFIAINNYSESDIQSFLVSKDSYLKDYSEGGRSAAKIIYDAAHGANDASGTLKGISITTSTGTISPKAILVTLQKEQSLVTMTAADRELNVDSYNNRLNKAMGYACPDGSSCNPSYAGFTKQVENAAWQLRYNYEIAGKDASWWSDNYGSSTAYYVNVSRTHSCGSSAYTVTYSNQSTASLYRYTPWICNGNYNFWKLMNEWFDASTTPPPPPSSNDTSAVETRTYGDSVSVQGSKDTSSRVYFDGQLIASAGTTTWSFTFTPQVANKLYAVEYRNESNTLIATKGVTVDRRKVGDITGDGRVDISDLSILGTEFGQGVPDGDWANLNPDVDSEVNILDLSLLADKWEG